MAAAGWYPDPAGTPQLRYWDGTSWTEHVAPAAPGTPAPAAWEASAQASGFASAPGARGATGTPAGFGRRMVAFLIDSVIVGLPIVLALAVVALSLPIEILDDLGAFAGPVVAFVLFALALTYAYNLLDGSAAQATVGKRVMGLKVIDVTTGGRVGSEELHKRVALKTLVPGVLNLLPGVGGLLALGYYLSALADQPRRAPHDRVASTLVVPR